MYVSGGIKAGGGIKASGIIYTRDGIETVFIFDAYMRIGCELHPIEIWRAFTDAEISNMDTHALKFWGLNRGLLLSICDAVAPSQEENNNGQID